MRGQRLARAARKMGRFVPIFLSAEGVAC